MHIIWTPPPPRQTLCFQLMIWHVHNAMFSNNDLDLLCNDTCITWLGGGGTSGKNWKFYGNTFGLPGNTYNDEIVEFFNVAHRSADHSGTWRNRSTTSCDIWQWFAWHLSWNHRRHPHSLFFTVFYLNLVLKPMFWKITVLSTSSVYNRLPSLGLKRCT